MSDHNIARRVTVDLTPSAAAEFDQLEEASGSNVGQIVHGGLSLIRQIQSFKAEHPGTSELATRDASGKMEVLGEV